jgi:glycerol-3-phosphate dehydrogenase
VADPRLKQVERLKEAELDVLIVGGGINGAGILRDLVLRAAHTGLPLRAGLVEKDHFGSGTSGKNSHLIHGGLRYLKYFQFELVRESLHERSVLLKIAPQFVRPLPFLLPMFSAKSRWMYGTGLWLYDRLAGANAIAQHRIIAPREVARIEPEFTQQGLKASAIFYDGQVESGPLVIENVLDAISRGAAAANYVKAEDWERRQDGRWLVRCLDSIGGQHFELQARKLVDARGAWAGGESLRLVRGSHIVIPRVNASDHAIAHFEADGRIVFLIPWGSRKQLTLVGTTDVDHAGGPDSVHVSRAELAYLIGVVRKLFPSRADVAPVSTFSSLRPLVKDHSGSATSTGRGHRIWNSKDGILHIAGGKYTTYRLMSEQAADSVCQEIAPSIAGVHVTEHTEFPIREREMGDAMEQHLRDYLFVTTTLGYEQRWNEQALMPLANALARKLGWNETRLRQEVDDIMKWSQPVGA